MREPRPDLDKATTGITDTETEIQRHSRLGLSKGDDVQNARGVPYRVSERPDHVHIRSLGKHAQSRRQPDSRLDTHNRIAVYREHYTSIRLDTVTERTHVGGNCARGSRAGPSWMLCGIGIKFDSGLLEKSKLGIVARSHGCSLAEISFCEERAASGWEERNDACILWYSSPHQCRRS